MKALQRLEQVNPRNNKELCDQLLSKLDRTDSVLDNKAHQIHDELLVAFHDMYARYRFDFGINTDFKMKQTKTAESPAYIQNFVTPINLEGDILTAIALLRKYGNITISSHVRTKKTKW